MKSARRESQDRATEATGARAAKLLAAERVTAAERGLAAAAERATAAERGLEAAKVHLTETEAALQKSLETLETERKARSEVDREVLALWGKVLGVEESNARLLEKVTRQEEGLSILESTHLGMYLFRLW